MTQNRLPAPGTDTEPEIVPVTLYLRSDIHRAFRRCVWIIAHETGRDQMEIMDEMVHDFLVKHGC